MSSFAIMGLFTFLLACRELADLRLTPAAPLDLVGDCATRDDAVPLFEDADADGYGNELLVAQGCLPAAGWVDRGGDCNDDDAAIHEGRGELCNGIDDNCNFAVDEAPEVLWCADKDRDEYGDVYDGVHACEQPAGYLADCTDCDDDSEDVHPGVAEIPGDDLDNDCDGAIDE